MSRDPKSPLTSWAKVSLDNQIQWPLQLTIQSTMFARIAKPQWILKRSIREFASSASRSADFTHVVIGAGAVGLAVARKLAERDGTSTLLIERHGAVGTETSSRNSEVSFALQLRLHI